MAAIILSSFHCKIKYKNNEFWNVDTRDLSSFFQKYKKYSVAYFVSVAPNTFLISINITDRVNFFGKK